MGPTAIIIYFLRIDFEGKGRSKEFGGEVWKYVVKINVHLCSRMQRRIQFHF